MEEPMRERVSKTKRNIWLIIIILLLLIVAAIIYLLLVYYKVGPVLPGQNNNNNLNQVTAETPAPATSLEDFNKPDASILAQLQTDAGQPAANEKEQALVVATAFAERFGSYSNQGNFENFDDLQIFMTDSMDAWVKKYKADLQLTYSDVSIYYAVLTKAISNTIKSQDDKNENMEIIIKTQRQEFKESPTNPRVYYQDLLLKLVKVNNDWKINGAYWQ